MRLSFSLTVPIFAAFISLTANSAPLKFFVATEYGIDQETGQKVPVILNRSGEVALKFFDGGIEIHFENSNKKNSMYRIHLDFEGLFEAPIESRKAALEIHDNIRLNGPRAMAAILRQISDNASASQQKVVLMLDAHKSPGFFKTDFDLAAVRILSTAGENVRFQNLVAKSFLPVNRDKLMAQNSESSSETTHITCEHRFISTK